jgi:membrane protease YdiL (CAAX protease family)
MPNLRFVIAWIVSAIVMYSAFYCWHGILSNDFYKIQYPKGIFMLFSALVYIVISFVLTKIFEHKRIHKKIKNLHLRALAVGSVFGFLLFAITSVIGIGFSKPYSVEILIVDLIWQITEQTLGAFIVAFAHIFIFAPDFEEERN